ncbi:hypothetical protein J4558_06970 [Leptolyngbya sp. 15MV]|nr:hypothetical protein J4558_06970 [Leptolyngbya sp. 15MV]
MQAKEHSWFAEALRGALGGFLDLDERFRRETWALHDRERRLARELLADGRLVDLQTQNAGACLFVKISGSAPLIWRSSQQVWAQQCPGPRTGAGACGGGAGGIGSQLIQYTGDLSETEREAMDAEDRAAQEAGTHAPFEWVVKVSA